MKSPNRLTPPPKDNSWEDLWATLTEKWGDTPAASPDPRSLMEALGGPEAALNTVDARRRGAPVPLVDETLGTGGAKGNDPRLAAFDRYVHGAKSASQAFGPDALVPFQLATVGAVGAGYEGFKKLAGDRGLRLLARLTGDPNFTMTPETTSPASAGNVKEFIKGLIEGGVYNRGIVPPPADPRQHPAASAVERAAQRFRR